MPSLQRDFMCGQVKVNVVPEYWGVFIIIDILNSAEFFIERHVILRGNMPCGKVQEQRDVAGLIMTIPKENATPGLWLPVGKLLTV